MASENVCIECGCPLPAIVCLCKKCGEKLEREIKYKKLVEAEKAKERDRSLREWARRQRGGR